MTYFKKVKPNVFDKIVELLEEKQAVKRIDEFMCMNAANEIVVREFLNKKIGFLQMSDIIENTMAKIAYITQPTYEDYIQTDIEARRVAESFIK